MKCFMKNILKSIRLYHHKVKEKVYTENWTINGKNYYFKKIIKGYYNECKVTSADGKYAIDYYVISKAKWEGDIAWVFTRNNPYCSIYSYHGSFPNVNPQYSEYGFGDLTKRLDSVEHFPNEEWEEQMDKITKDFCFDYFKNI